tara:strand:- start:1072 stop:3042 length:1971 start_codon:yes stop_codon:yes gene_type:complete
MKDANISTENLTTVMNDDHLLAKAHIDSIMNGKKIKRVLFVNPPDVDESIFDYEVAKRGRGNNYPSYGIGILTAQLSRLGYDTDIINLNHELLKKVYYSKNSKEFNYLNEWQSLINEKVKEFKPDIIGVSCLFSVTHNSFKKVCKHIKNNFKNLPVIVGGVHVSHDLDGVFKDLEGVDFVCMYEADLALPNLFDIINGKKEIKDLAQFAFKSKDKIVSFKKRLVPDGHTMSVMPAYNKMDIKDHSKYGTIGSWHGMLKKDVVVSTAQSNRGCRASCTFCNVRTYHGKTVRHRTVDSVVDELLCLQNDYGVEHIVWLDDDLLKDHKRTLEMFNEMVKRNLKLTWDATNGVIAHSLKQKEIVQGAFESGCIGLHIGIESGNPEILKQIRKPGTVETFIEASEVLKMYPKINTRALLMLGFPKETLSMIFDTIELAEKINFDWANLSILQPWKGTPIYEEMSDAGLLGDKEGTLKTEDNDKAPYQLGTYSRQRAIESGKIVEKTDFNEIKNNFLDRVKAKDLNVIPSPGDLDNLWFYMNFRINFARLLREQRPDKIDQQYRFLKHITTKTAPDNAMMIYFFGLMEKKSFGKVSDITKTRLKERLNNSNYWSEKFDSLNLSFDDIKLEKFPENISNCGIPNNYTGNTDRFDFPTNKIVNE